MALKSVQQINYAAEDGAGGGKKRRRRLPAGVTHPVDIHVGGRVRVRRTMLSMSQEKLGDMVGLTFQQIQKYERGANRIGASRLYQFSRILDVPVSFFFDDMPANALAKGPVQPVGMADHDQAALNDDPLARKETLELVRAYYRISDPTMRKQLFDLVRSMGNLPNSE